MILLFPPKQTIRPLLLASLSAAAFLLAPAMESGARAAGTTGQESPGTLQKEGSTSSPGASEGLVRAAQEQKAEAILDQLFEQGAARGGLSLDLVDREFLRDELQETLLTLLNLQQNARHDGREDKVALYRQALDEIARGNTALARAFFHGMIADFEDIRFQLPEEEQSVGQRITAEAARGLGSLALLQDLKQAVHFYEEATRLAPGHIEYWRQLATVLEYAGQPDKAEQALLSGLNVARAYNDPKIESGILGDLGYLTRRRGRVPAAISHFEQALAFAEKHNLQDDALDYMTRLALLVQDSGDYQEAEKLHSQLLAKGEELGRLDIIARQYGHLGGLAMERQQWVLAEPLLLKALEMDEQLGNQEGMANHLGNLAAVSQYLGDLEKTDRYITRSLALERSMGRKYGIAVDLGNLGFIKKMRGDLDAAERLFREAMALNQELGRRKGIAIQHMALGDLALERKQYSRAREHIEAGLRMFTEMEMDGYRDKALRMLASLPDSAK